MIELENSHNQMISKIIMISHTYSNDFIEFEFELEQKTKNLKFNYVQPLHKMGRKLKIEILNVLDIGLTIC